jgi:hypothetical protein
MTKARDLANIISGGFTADDIPSLDTAKITTGTFADARMPSTVLNSNVDLTNLSATNLTSGTLPDARFPATLPAISGANLTNLPAGGDFVKLASTTQTTGDAINSLSFNGYFDDDTYSVYKAYISNYNLGNNADQLGLRVLVANSVDTGSNYYWRMFGQYAPLGTSSWDYTAEWGIPNSFPEIFRSMDNNDNSNYRGVAEITIYHPESSGYKWIKMQNIHIYNNGTEYIYYNGLTDIYYRQTSVLTGINFSTSGSNSFAGTFALYGLKK